MCCSRLQVRKTLFFSAQRPQLFPSLTLHAPLSSRRQRRDDCLRGDWPQQHRQTPRRQIHCGEGEGSDLREEVLPGKTSQEARAEGERRASGEDSSLRRIATLPWPARDSLLETALEVCSAFSLSGAKFARKSLDGRRRLRDWSGGVHGGVRAARQIIWKHLIN